MRVWLILLVLITSSVVLTTNLRANEDSAVDHDSPKAQLDGSIDQEMKQLIERLSALLNDPANADQIRQYATQLHELQNQAYESRIARIEGSLAELRSQLKKRRDNSKQEIEQWIKQMIADQKTSPKDKGKSPEWKPNANPEIDDTLPAAVIAGNGWQRWMKQDYSSAYQHFLVALKKDPELTLARNGLGWSQFHLGMWDEAEIAFKKVLDAELDHGGAINGLGQAYLARGNTEEAIKWFRTGVDNQIEESGEKATVQMGLSAWFGLVQALDQQGDTDEAIDWAERWLQHDNNAMMQRLLEQLRRKQSQAD
ncbi:MAG: tetratricopeptide repeat protein [Planctomycetota bacterium]